MAISEDGKSVMDTLLYYKAMEEAAKIGVSVFAHCEDKSLAADGVMNAGEKADELGLPGISNAVEDIITARDVLMAKETGAKLHLCHCSTKGSTLYWIWQSRRELILQVKLVPITSPYLIRIYRKMTQTIR